MAIQSMTGYGASVAERDGWSLAVELRSVNHRGLDVRVNTPAGLACLEPTVRDAVKRACGRGRVECRLTVTPPTDTGEDGGLITAAQQLYGRLEQVREQTGIETPTTLGDLLAAGLDMAQKGERKDFPELDDLLVEAMENALASLVSSREREGRYLVDEFGQRLERSASLINHVEVMRERATDDHRQRLHHRINEILTQLGAVSTLDEGRLLQEMAVYIDRCDITEEIVRAKSHIATLQRLFLQEDPDQLTVGKKVDFFLQELGREANTMASKSNVAEMTEQVVSLKGEIERMREQALNIE